MIAKSYQFLKLVGTCIHIISSNKNYTVYTNFRGPSPKLMGH